MSDSPYLDYAQQLADQGDLAGAEDALRVMLRMPRMSALRPVAVRLLAELLLRRGETAQAIELLHANRMDPGCGDLLREHLLGERDHAAVRALLAERPATLTASAWLDKAVRRHLDGDLAGAIDACHAALDLAPDEPMALNHLGRAQFNRGQAETARTLFERATALRPGFAQAWHNLGLVLRSAGDLPAAIQAYARACERAPAYRSARLNLAITHILAKQPRHALPHLERLHAERPDDDEVLLNLCACQLLLGQLVEAEAGLRTLVARHPDDPQALAQLGNLLHRTGRLDEAGTALGRALHLEPRNATLRLELLAVRLAQQRRGDVMALLREGLALEPRHAGLLQLLRKLREGWPQPAPAGPARRH